MWKIRKTALVYNNKSKNQTLGEKIAIITFPDEHKLLTLLKMKTQKQIFTVT